MRQLPDVPYVLSWPSWCRANRPRGNRWSGCWLRLPDGCPPVAWGMNCGSGPDGLLSAVEAAMRFCALPLIVQPNAGMPREVENRRIYFCSPEYLTAYAKRYVALGVSAVGGCCGTTPEHIREIARAVKPLSRRGPLPPWPRPRPRRRKPAAPLAEKSRLAGGWRSGNGSPRWNWCRRAAMT